MAFCNAKRPEPDIRLDEIPMSRFIDMMCGDLHALGEAPEDVLEAAARKLRMAYYAVTNAREARAHVSTGDRSLRLRMRLFCLGQAEWMARAGDTDNAGKVMKALGDNATGADVGARIAALRRETEFMLARMERDGKTGEKARGAEEIRAGFTKERAFLMTYHKMYIDINVMTAGEYAHILAMTDREINARMEAAKKRRR